MWDRSWEKKFDSTNFVRTVTLYTRLMLIIDTIDRGLFRGDKRILSVCTFREHRALFIMPCDKLQALWSQVKFLKTKEGCAMIQMGDSIAVERCLQNLNNVTIGTDGRLQLGFSKQAFLSDVTNPYILPDKTASFKDFTGSKNNRWVLVLATLRILFSCHFSLSSFFPSWRPFVSAWSFFHSPRYFLVLYIRWEDIYIYILLLYISPSFQGDCSFLAI